MDVSPAEPSKSVPLGRIDRRRNAIQEIGAKYRGTVQKGEVIYARRMLDTTLHDRMHDLCQLSDDQHTTAEWLYRLRSAARVDRRIVARLDVVREEIEGDDQEHEDADPDAAYQRYKEVMCSLAGCVAAKVESMLCGQHPGTPCLATVQHGLDALRVRWGR